uniref:Hemicentin-2 n=1 Tax=Aceria tosichella TaxID=561515 RepID=A0A6G1SD09_9ACAR
MRKSLVIATQPGPVGFILLFFLLSLLGQTVVGQQNVQFTYVGPPKILPIATADSYPEGATINLICTVSGGQRKGLALNWEKDGRELNDESLRYSNEYGSISIEKTGTDISILRISNATHEDSGRYTCKAKNPIGEDSTSAQLVINVELKWNKVPADTEIGLNKDVTIECDATSQPNPIIQWTKLPSSTSKGLNDSNKSIVVSQGKYLKITRAQHKDSGLYECTAHNGADSLRRVIQLTVRGKL